MIYYGAMRVFLQIYNKCIYNKKKEKKRKKVLLIKIRNWNETFVSYGFHQV